jgi:hypothetical protein
MVPALVPAVRRRRSVEARGSDPIDKGDFSSKVVPWARRWGRWLFLAAGLAAATALVLQVGPRRLWDVLVQSGPVIPAIIALDAVWMSCEAAALLVTYGPARRSIPVRELARSVVTTYATMAILPVGRVGAEIARATILGPYVGSQKAAAGAARIQILVLFANTAVCVPCFLASARLGARPAPVAAAPGQPRGQRVLGLGLLLLSRNIRVGGWLGRRFQKMASWGPELDAELRSGPAFPLPPRCWPSPGRAAQAFEYGLGARRRGRDRPDAHRLAARRGHPHRRRRAGRRRPNQVGISEGMYRLFAAELGLGASPERALAIPIIIRAANFVAAGLCFALIAVWPKAGSGLRASGSGSP